MPFRLTNILAIFQGYINKILVEKLNVLIIIYLNNIFIYSESEKKIHESCLMNTRLAEKTFVIY